jgi:hypothetical protein
MIRKQIRNLDGAADEADAAGLSPLPDHPFQNKESFGKIYRFGRAVEGSTKRLRAAVFDKCTQDLPPNCRGEA